MSPLTAPASDEGPDGVGPGDPTYEQQAFGTAVFRVFRVFRGSQTFGAD